MDFYIRKHPNGEATLMTRDGMYLFTFRNVDSARQACEDWYRLHWNETNGITSKHGADVSSSGCG